MISTSVGELGRLLSGVIGKGRPIPDRHAGSTTGAEARAVSEEKRPASSTSRTASGSSLSDEARAALLAHLSADEREIATAAGREEPLELPATADEIVDALMDGLVPRLVVLSPAARPRARGFVGSSGAARLARTMRRDGLSTVVIDLTKHGDVAAAMGVPRLVAGLKDWQSEQASPSEIIHRDAASLAHVVPAAGFDVVAADQDEVADLVFFVVACCGVYDCVMLACGPDAVDLLPALLDDDAALILDGGVEGIHSITGPVNALGIKDWLELAPELPGLA